MHRRGITLTEVLVAIFVCGLGLMALMTLFPLGAMNMAQALKDDRCGHCAANATAILRTMWRASLESNSIDPILQNKLAAGPVYIDPLGKNMFPAPSIAGTAIPRETLPGMTTFNGALRWCALMDDIDFNPNAKPVVSGGEVLRQGRYSWAWMVRWPPGAEQLGTGPRARVLEFSVVVYHNRPVALNVAALPVGESGPYPASFDAARRKASVAYAGVRPPIRKTGWILDVTPDAVTNQPHGYFYRVESVQDTGTSLEITVQGRKRGNFAGNSGSIVFMENVAEVFERSTLE